MISSADLEIGLVHYIMYLVCNLYFIIHYSEIVFSREHNGSRQTK